MDTKLQINLKEQPTVLCESCGSDRFREVTFIKKVSKLMTGAQKDTIVPFPTYCCDKCGYINNEFDVFTDD